MTTSFDMTVTTVGARITAMDVISITASGNPTDLLETNPQNIPGHFWRSADQRQESSYQHRLSPRPTAPQSPAMQLLMSKFLQP